MEPINDGWKDWTDPLVLVNSENPFFLRDYLLAQAKQGLESDDFKRAVLDIISSGETEYNPVELPKYRQCALAGYAKAPSTEIELELTRLLGQAHSIAGTPSPWVSDIWAVLGIKLAVINSGNLVLAEKFNEWVGGFLVTRIRDGRLKPFEASIADYILSGQTNASHDPSAQLLLLRLEAISPPSPEVLLGIQRQFSSGFLSLRNNSVPPIERGLSVILFDTIVDTSTVPTTKFWTPDDLLKFLENIPSGMRKWTWEDKPKTSGGRIAQWFVDNEYHVQNLLYILLAPMFPDVTDEFYTDNVGQKKPRGDLYIPTLDTIIEVKYRKTASKSFSDLISEVAEDASLYRADPKYNKSKLFVFLWDQTRASQEHGKFKEGALKIPRIDGCVSISAPSPIEV